LQIISKKKLIAINKFRNKHKKEKILINKKIKNKIINNSKVINKNKNKKILNNKIITQSKIKNIFNIKCKRLMLILGRKFKKKLIELKVIDINKILRIIQQFPRYSYKIYSIKKRPKKFIRQIKLLHLFRI
jgi:hypothetical protein